jgi:hypothetical protein
LLLVVRRLKVDASSQLEPGGCASVGLTNLPTVKTIALAE